VVGPDGNVIAPGATLPLNADGWPSPNPIDLRITLACPANATGGCGGGAVDVQALATSGRARLNGMMIGDQCVADPAFDDRRSNSRLHYNCNRIGNGLAAGETRTLRLNFIVEPSDAATLQLAVSWAGLAAEQSIGVPRAQIHPVMIVPDVLGTLPPAYSGGALDPLLGSYEPLMEQLLRLGYEEGVSLFRMPYDWRDSARLAAGALRSRISAARSVSAPYVASNAVDVIAHGMGGTVARAYVQGRALDSALAPVAYGNDVRKIIVVASAQRGFPASYKAFESNSWSDWLRDTPWLAASLDWMLWPALARGHWLDAHPGEATPVVCFAAPTASGKICRDDLYKMTHDIAGGSASLAEMLPATTPESEAGLAPYFGPYLCESSAPCAGTGRYPFGVTANPLLLGLNADVSALHAENIYVL